jgi:hypothetical protein
VTLLCRDLGDTRGPRDACYGVAITRADELQRRWLDRVLAASSNILGESTRHGHGAALVADIPAFFTRKLRSAHNDEGLVDRLGDAFLRGGYVLNGEGRA